MWFAGKYSKQLLLIRSILFSGKIKVVISYFCLIKCVKLNRIVLFPHFYLVYFEDWNKYFQ